MTFDERIENNKLINNDFQNQKNIKNIEISYVDLQSTNRDNELTLRKE